MMESTHHQNKSLIENSTYIVITTIIIVELQNNWREAYQKQLFEVDLYVILKTLFFFEWLCLYTSLNFYFIDVQLIYNLLAFSQLLCVSFQFFSQFLTNYNVLVSKVKLYTCIYTYIHSNTHSFYSSPLWFATEYRIQFPVLHSRTLFIHSVYNSLHLLIPASHSAPPPPPYPSSTTNPFSTPVRLFLFHG